MTIACIHFFPGFYYSWLSEGINNKEEQFLENEASEPDAEFHAVPRDKLAESLFDSCNYSIAFQMLAREWTSEFIRQAREAMPDFWGRFESMDSPREYNFTTDRVYIRIDRKKAARYRKAARHSKTFAGLVRERFTSRSGFISFYSADVADWYDSDEWDHNQWGTLIEACLIAAGLDLATLEESILYALHENGCFYEAFEASVNWAKLREACAITERDN